jgi:hypothetical protein
LLKDYPGLRAARLLEGKEETQSKRTARAGTEWRGNKRNLVGNRSNQCRSSLARSQTNIHADGHVEIGRDIQDTSGYGSGVDEA